MTQDTLQDKRIEEDNESLIQEMVRDAETVELPNELKSNPIIHKGDGELEAPMTVKELSFAGYKNVWDTRTYKWAPVLQYMLTQKLRERRPDGSYIWTANNPHKPPVGGHLKCLLHEDSPNRKEYDKMGFRVCKKNNIPNDHEVKQHMLKKHPREWDTIEDKRKEMERQEDRAVQRALFEAVSGKANSGNPTDRLDVTAHPLADKVIMNEVMAKVAENLSKKPIGTSEAPLYVSDKDKAKIK